MIPPIFLHRAALQGLPAVTGTEVHYHVPPQLLTSRCFDRLDAVLQAIGRPPIRLKEQEQIF